MTESLLSFTVYGDPAPQGSKKAVGRSSTGRVLLVESSKKVKPWREVVRAAALHAWETRFPRPTPNPVYMPPRMVMGGPLHLSVVFTLKKPVKVPRDREGMPTTYPDLDKLLRATCDALTHSDKTPGVILDDSLIVRITAEKVYETDFRNKHALRQPGAVISIYLANPEINVEANLTHQHTL